MWTTLLRFGHAGWRMLVLWETGFLVSVVEESPMDVEVGESGE